jgi:hypothetical protein
MAYESECVEKSQKIFYHLICHGALGDDEPGMVDYYRAYVEDEQVQTLVKRQAEIADSKVERYGNMIILMPDIGNKYLGFTKAQLKKEMCKSDATDKDYYLAQFILITLLVEFYDGQGSRCKSRTFIKIGDLQNIVSERLREGRKLEEEREEKDEELWNDVYENVLDYKSMCEAYEALRSTDEGSKAKTTKEGIVGKICRFLENQELIAYFPADDTIKTTSKLDNIMEYNLLNRDNYNRIMEVLEEAHEQNKQDKNN